MVSVVPSLLAGAVFGLALAAPPGPMNAVIAEESVTNGLLAGVRAGLGALSADAVFFVCSLLGVVTVVERVPTVRAAMVGVGGFLMLYFAYDAATSARSGASTGSTDPSGAGAMADLSQSKVEPSRSEAGSSGSDAGPSRSEAGSSSRSTGFRKAFALAITNPYQVVFWLTIGVGLLKPGRLDALSYTPYLGADLSGLLVVRTGSPALLVGFFLGIGCWIVCFPATLRATQRRVARFAPLVAGLSALVLGGFGVVFLVDAVRTVT